MTNVDRLKKLPVYIYTHIPITPFGSGTHIRQYTNVRAYLDLGFSVSVVQFAPDPEKSGRVILPDGATHTLLPARPRIPNIKQRLAYHIGFPLEDALNVIYTDRHSILDAVNERELKTPGAIHHFEYSATANAAISKYNRDMNLIWSCHDWESDRITKVDRLRREIGRRKKVAEKIRRIYFARRIERLITKRCKLVLMIAEHETKIFRSKLGIRNAELLPMSLPDETLPLRTRDWCENGVLRMLHVGSPDAMIGYYSLKFILEEVMPHIPDAIRSKLELIVAGKNQDTEYSRIIRKLAGPYPQVKFIGYVDDLLPLYGDSDVQLVGSSTATGLRTRIIESFVRGVPVLSTSAAAEGIVGLRDGHNIFLADSSELFAGRLISLQKDPSLLPILSENGRALYQTNYSRKVTAERLCTLLEQYL